MNIYDLLEMTDDWTIVDSHQVGSFWDNFHQT